MKPDNTVDTLNSGYALGAVKQIQAQNWKDGAVWPTTRTTNFFAWWEGAVTELVWYDPDIATTGQNYSDYVNEVVGGRAQLAYVDIADGRPRKAVFRNDMLGQVFRRDEKDNLSGGDPHEVWYRYSGRELGYVGNNGKMDVDYATSVSDKQSPPAPSSFADFDLAYDAINAYEQGGRGGVYTVQSGDTLQSIAANLWGDASLWWKLAETNGLTAESPLVEGALLIIPVGVQSNSNNAATFKPYDPLEVLGNLSPTAPKPGVGGKQCGAFGKFMMVVAAIAVAQIVGPMAGKFFAGMMGADAAVAGAIAGGTATAAEIAAASTSTLVAAGAGAAVGGAAGSIVSQGVGLATGIQEKFSWNAVALAAIGGAVGVGVAKFAPGLGVSVKAMVSEAVTQAIGKATGLQEKFSWAGVAAAGVGAYVGGAAVRRFGGGDFTRITAATLASAATRSLIEGSDFGDNMLAALPNMMAQIAFARTPFGEQEPGLYADEVGEDTERKYGPGAYIIGKNGDAAYSNAAPNGWNRLLDGVADFFGFDNGRFSLGNVGLNATNSAAVSQAADDIIVNGGRAYNFVVEQIVRTLPREAQPMAQSYVGVSEGATGTVWNAAVGTVRFATDASGWALGFSPVGESVDYWTQGNAPSWLPSAARSHTQTDAFFNSAGTVLNRFASDPVGAVQRGWDVVAGAVGDRFDDYSQAIRAGDYRGAGRMVGSTATEVALVVVPITKASLAGRIERAGATLGLGDEVISGSARASTSMRYSGRRWDVRAKFTRSASAQSSTPGHSFASRRAAYGLALDPEVTHVTMNVGYARLLGVDSITANLPAVVRPDAAALYVDNRIARIEIMSDGDRLASALISRNTVLDPTLQRLGYKPLPPRAYRPTRE